MKHHCTILLFHYVAASGEHRRELCGRFRALVHPKRTHHVHPRLTRKPHLNARRPVPVPFLDLVALPIAIIITHAKSVWRRPLPDHARIAGIRCLGHAHPVVIYVSNKKSVSHCMLSFRFSLVLWCVCWAWLWLWSRRVESCASKGEETDETSRLVSEVLLSCVTYATHTLCREILVCMT